MFSSRRRATASSSAIKMLAAMAFPARYNYLSRIGALWPMPINARLSVDGRLPPDCRRRSDGTQVSNTMPSRSSSALRKPTAARKPNKKPKPGPAKLPEWNLADLYSGIDAPEVTRDLQRLDAECVAFETDYKGKLVARTAAAA